MSSQPASASSLRDTNTRLNLIACLINQVQFIKQVKERRKKYALRFTLALACVLAIAVSASIAPHAQLDKNAAVRVVSLSERETGGGGKVFTIESSPAILRPQTWHDSEGLHVVIYKGEAKANLGASFGIKQRRIGDSLELVLPAAEAAGLSVRQRGSQIEITVPRATTASTRAFDSSLKGAPVIAYEPSIARETKRGNATPRTKRQSSSSISSSTNASASERASSINDAPTIEGSSLIKNAPQVESYARHNANVRSLPRAPVAWSTPALSGKTIYVAPSASLKDSYSPGTWAGAKNGNGNPVIDPAANTTANTNITANANLAVNANIISPAAVTTPPASTLDLPASPTPVQTTTNIAVEQIAEQEKDESDNSTIYVALAMFAALAVILLVAQRRRAAQHATEFVPVTQISTATSQSFERDIVENGEVTRRANSPLDAQPNVAEAMKDSRWLKRGKGKNDLTLEVGSSVKPHSNGALENHKNVLVASAPAPIPLVTFGAFQVDREVAKLLQNQAVRLDVLGSRASEDRLALEAALMKNFRAADTDETFKRKVRVTLEEYGFVARMSASLLLAPEACDRVSSARSLGELQTSVALPFLLEALYDREPVVRNEAVIGLGALGNPQAIGALLDTARRNTDIPSTLLRAALEKCSVASLNFDTDGTSEKPALDGGLLLPHDITAFESVPHAEALPRWIDDEHLTDAMERAASADSETRAAAARTLAQYQVGRAVETLTQLATGDSSVAVRAAAVSSLGMTDHESVLVPVLLCLVDEAREVRAAAARSLSRFGFDRADAYVRIIEQADAETINKISHALADAGFAAQSIERLTSDDRRQAYEAFSLLSLIVKGGNTTLILNAIENHQNLNTRLALVRFLRISNDDCALKALRALNERAELALEVRAAIEAGNANAPSETAQLVGVGETASDEIADEETGVVFAADSLAEEVAAPIEQATQPTIEAANFDESGAALPPLAHDFAFNNSGAPHDNQFPDYQLEDLESSDIKSNEFSSEYQSPNFCSSNFESSDFDAIAFTHVELNDLDSHTEIGNVG